MRYDNRLEKQDLAFLAHIKDLFLFAQQKSTTRFTSFLDMHQLVMARQIALSSGYSNFMFFSGYPKGERAILGVFSEFGLRETFPITPITLSFRNEDHIGHRDILGSLMGLEIARESIGDILVGDGVAVVFVLNSVSLIILNELKKVGNCGIKASEGMPLTLPPLHNYLDVTAVVSSLRLDCIVAAMAGISRDKSSHTIKSQFVSINGAQVCNPSCKVLEEDIVSIRGFGKFLFVNVLKTTKKGRLQILYKKYV